MKTAHSFPNLEAAKVWLGERVGRLTGEWQYHDSEANVVLTVLRLDTAVGEEGVTKTFRPLTCQKDGRWVIRDPKGALPLYCLPELLARPKEEVFVTEGEKAADVLRSLNLLTTTSAHGSNSARKTDWSPLAGRKVIIVPDHDSAGEAYCQEVVAILRGLSTPSEDLRVLQLPSLPPSGDAVEFVEEQRCAGRTEDEIREETRRLAGEAPAAAREPDEPVKDLRPEAVLLPLHEVQPRPVEWLWPGRIPLGKVSVISGDPDLGKSTITLDIAARVSRGSSWPDDDSLKTPQGSVILLSAEDDAEDTIVPRLSAAGADLHRIKLLKSVKRCDAESPFSLDRDLPALARSAEAIPDLRLVVIDPILAYLGEKRAERNAEVRSLLAALAGFAARDHVAVVLVNHLNKSTGSNPLYRVMESLTFVAAPRAAWVVCRDPRANGRRLFMPLKNNLAGQVSGLAYRIEAWTGPCAVASCRVEWNKDPVHLDLEEVLQHRCRENRWTARDEAKEWLHEFLEGREVEATAALEAGKAAGHSVRTLRRAFEELGVECRKKSFEGGWVWATPSEDGQLECEDGQDGQHEEVATFEAQSGCPAPDCNAAADPQGSFESDSSNHPPEEEGGAAR